MHTNPSVPQYHHLHVPTDELGTFDVHYIEAGLPDLPTVLLLHGFPSSSHQFHDFIPLISDSYHVLAPDLPGFGLTTSPADLKYNFDNLAAAIGAWLAALKITSYAVYIFDYGAPVAHRLILKNPDHVKAIIVQNGNSYEAGLSGFWSPIQSLWKSENGQKERDWLRDNFLTLEGTRGQYVTGVSDDDYCVANPFNWTTDYLMNLAGRENQERQLDLFYDYRKNIELYPQIHEYFKKSQVPVVVTWAKGDPIFIVPGAEAYKQDLPNAEVHILEGSHFLLETQRWEIAKIVKDFLGRNGYK